MAKGGNGSLLQRLPSSHYAADRGRIITTMNEALKLYNQFYPNVTPNIYQQDLIEASVNDLAAWQTTLQYWAGNDYRPQSIFKMLEYYSELTRKAASMRVGRSDGVTVPYAPPPPCGTCGADTCLKDHRYEQVM